MPRDDHARAPSVRTVLTPGSAPRSASVFTILAALVFAGGSSAEILDFTITLDGTQEVSATDSTGTGTGTASLNTDTNLLTWAVTFSGLSGPATAAHFHGAAPLCETAGPEITLVAASPINGAQVLTAQQASDVIAGLWYVNIHTALHPPGEIRGQVVPTPIGNPVPAPIPAGSIHVRLDPVATGLTAPNWGACAPGHPDRLFVTDQSGTLWAIDLTTGTKSVFLDVSAMLVPLGIFGPESFDERGLLGVAFHPDYPKNGLLYTYTSEPVGKTADFSTIPLGGTADHQALIREWNVPDPVSPKSVVDPKSTRVLLRIDEPQFNHNAGNVAFGDDGMLYVALGDGGGADDHDGQPFIGGVPLTGHGCGGNGGDPSNPLGSILRIDPQGTNAANGAYGIPGDNPFVGVNGFVEEIFAYGLRNPFRFSFDQADDTLYIADVGQNQLEEINIGVAGAHYGWNHKEGSFFFLDQGAANGGVTDVVQSVPAGLTDPLAEYDHDEGLAIIGGFVYRGTKIAPLVGRYVFGDFAQTFSNDGRLFHLDGDDAIVEFPLVGQPTFGQSLLGFGQDTGGEVYVLANDTGTPFGATGVVYRLATKIGDLNADGVTGFDDLVALLANWGPCAGCPADLDMNGDVGFDDLVTLLANWS